MRAPLFSAIACVSVVLGCQPAAETTWRQPESAETTRRQPESAIAFETELRQASKEYKAWGRVDDEARWAPLYCRMPNPGAARFSVSKDEETHGQKLYSLFAKKHDAYVGVAKSKAAPVGQVIVKESWIPEEMADMKPGETDRKKIIVSGRETETQDHFYPYASKDGKVFKASKQSGLYIMMKLDPKTAGTDEGWVYGTLSADGKQVTSAGKVVSCMKCHQDAKYDRQFGLGKSE